MDGAARRRRSVIHYLAVDWKPLHTFLDSAGRELADRLRPLPYPELSRQHRDGTLAPGTYIFTDFERLGTRELRAAASTWSTLEARPDVRLLNHPLRSLRRHALLETLHRLGRNHFTAHRAWRVPRHARFPVFLRTEHEHLGNASELLYSRGEVLLGIARYALRRPNVLRWARRLLAVEHLDVADAAGVYRKYSCFAVGGAIVPRHLFLARRWMVKHASILDPDALAEEQEFLEGNPHRDELREIFRIARVDFGRVDYGVAGGRVQVWEINTNAMIAVAEDRVPQRAHALESFTSRFVPLLASLAG
jgi:hypothetical protein